MLVDEHLYFLMGRSSSAWAKNAEALRRISLAWRGHVRQGGGESGVVP
jgi:hypothetical protein